MRKPSNYTMIFLLVLGFATLLAARFLTLEASARTSAGDAKKSTPDGTVLMFTRAPSFSAQAWIRGGERFPQGGSIVVKNGNDSHLLAADFAATVDLSLNFEGTSVLFAGKAKPDDPWQVYEVPATEGSPRRVTSGEEDCIRPMYLPDGRIVYSRKTGGRFVLEVAALDGSGKPLRLTYAPGNFLPTAVLHDGRVLFESSFPLGTAGQPEIYTVYPDGSGVEAYRCDHGHARSNGIQTADGDILFTSRHGLGRFTSPLAHEVTVNVPEGDYDGGIAEIEPKTGAFILSSRSASSRLDQAAATNKAEQPYVLKLWTPGTRTLTTVAAERGENLVEPVLVTPRPVANRFPTALHPWTTTNLLALNSYISRDGDTPSGTLEVVRVSTLDASGKVKVLGTAPVEKDGSFFVQAPGDSPLKFELLNAQGNVVRKENGWMWARSGEQRICVGCHAGPERAPDNAVPGVLLRTTTPVDLTGAPAEAAKGAN
ncbi:MAG: hypothetical protein ABSB39_23455 [Candidatus Sulfotelmatobacter sp.]|jgi:hypothetical protein